MQICSDSFGFFRKDPFAAATTSQTSATTDSDGSTGTGSAPGSAISTMANPVFQALAEALRSLGLEVSGAGSGSGSSASASTTGASTSSQDSANTSGGASASSVNYQTIAQDIHHFVHSLFADIRAENLLASGGSASATSDGSTSSGATSTGSNSPFATGLTDLIAQVSGGSVPANLQATFGKLVSDLGQLGGSGSGSGGSSSSGSTSGSSASGSDTSSSGASGTQALLLQFLNNLQSDFGLAYGSQASAPGSSSTGLVVNTSA